MAGAIAGPLQERTNPIMLIGALLFAAIAAVLVFVALQSSGGGDSSPAAGATVVVAARDLPANTTLSPDMLTVASISSDAVVQGAYTSVEALSGTALRFPVAQGEQITPLKVGLNAIDDEHDLALVVPAGHRAFAVDVSEVTGVGGLLLPGNTVDVIAVFDETATGEDKAVTLLQNVAVLAVAQEAQEPVAPSAEPASDGVDSGRRPEDVEAQPDARTVTLAVTPEQAQQLALAQENGRLWLSLRPAGEGESAPPAESNLLPFRTP